MGEGSKFIEQVGNKLARAITGFSLPTTPEQPSDYYLTDSTQKPEKPITVPADSKDTLFHNFTQFLRQVGKLPQPGHGIAITDIQDARLLFGQEITRGSSGKAFVDKQDHTFTKLWETNPSEKWANQNEHQKQLYRRLNGQHPYFTFRREFPGGWSQELLDNQGNLEERLKAGHQLTREQIAQAVTDLHQMQELAFEAHGDLVKNPTLITEAAAANLRKDLERCEPFGYLNPQNILISPDGKLIFPDYAGNPDIFPLSLPEDQSRYDPAASQCMANELDGLQKGLQTIMRNQQNNPHYYQQLGMTYGEMERAGIPIPQAESVFAIQTETVK